MTMVRSRAPLRISLAGGGTDLDAYARHHGGLVINATIDLAAEVALVPREDDRLGLCDLDSGWATAVPFDALDSASIPDRLRLSAGVAAHVLSRRPMTASCGVDVYTSVGAPAGSGLGSSSTLTVALVAAWDRWCGRDTPPESVAERAYEIERVELGLAGGCQDQWAAAHGGLNQLAIERDGRVRVRALDLDDTVRLELETNLLLYDTGTSRRSATIIEAQQRHLDRGDAERLDSMHRLKAQASAMTDALQRGRLDLVGPLLEQGWTHKRATAEGITTPLTELARTTALEAGATGVKISGAGGGGFMLAYCPGVSRHRVASALAELGGHPRPVRFSTRGVTTWTSHAIR